MISTRWLARGGRTAALAGGALHVWLATPAHAQELRYSVTPVAQQLAWDDALGIDDTFLYGGRLGFVFGRRIELQGFYLTNQGSDASTRRLYDRLGVGGEPPQNPGLQLRNYGATVAYNFAVGGFTPFVRAGGSILRFEPTAAPTSERIALQYGGGLRFGKPGGLRFSVFVDDLRFRVDSRLLVALPDVQGGPGTFDGDGDRLRSNLAYGAGLTIPLGGAVAYDDRPQYRLSNVALPVDAFVGRLDFAGATGLARQNLVGVRTGIDFGPLVGLRGFYWQGVDDDFRSQAGVQGYGAEGQFSLNAGPGFNPFLLAGAGQIDFRSRYAGGASTGSPLAQLPADRTALILGGGVKIPVASRFTLTAAARNWLASRDGRTQDVVESGQLRSNWQYTAGLSFGLGGRGAARRPTSTAARVDTVFVDRATGARMQSAGEVAPDLAAPGTRTVVTERVVVTSTGDTLRAAAADSAVRADPAVRQVNVARARPAVGAAAAGYQSGQTILVPVPTEGEINIRYGPGGPTVTVAGSGGATGRETAAASGDLRALVRELVDAELAARGAGATGARIVREYREPSGRTVREYRDESDRPVREYVERDGRVIREQQADGRLAPTARAPEPRARPEAPSAASRARVEKDAADTERRVMERLDAMERERAASLSDADVRTIIREELAREAEQRRAAEAARPAPAPSAAPAAEPVPPPAPRPTFGGSGVQGGLAYSGVTFSGGAQALAGGRLDMGPLSPSLPGFRLVPEFALGFGGGGTSTYVAANAQYELRGPTVGRLGRIHPRASLGAGLLNFDGRVGGRSGLDVVLTPAYGVSLALPTLRSATGLGSPDLVVEHQGIGMFDVNRLVVGLGWRRR